MVSSIRSRGRNLLKGNVKTGALLALDIAAMLFCANLLPVVYENTLYDVIKSYVGQYEQVMNLLAATVIFFVVIALWFSMTSSAGRYFYKRAKGENTDAGDFFYYLSFGVFLSNFFFRLKLAITKLAGFLFCFLPFAVNLIVLYRACSGRSSALIIIVLSLAAAVFFLIGIAFYLSFTSLLFLCPYIFYDGKKSRISDAINDSQQIMIKRSVVLNKIRFSFAGWFLLCVFIVPLIYVWGLYSQTKAVAACDFLGG